MRAYQFRMTATTAATVALLVAACGFAQAQAGNVTSAPTDPAAVVQSADAQTVALTSFVLNQQFNFTNVSGTGNVNGADVTLDQRTAEGNVADTFKHTLDLLSPRLVLEAYQAARENMIKVLIAAEASVTAATSKGGSMAGPTETSVDDHPWTET